MADDDLPEADAGSPELVEAILNLKPVKSAREATPRVKEGEAVPDPDEDPDDPVPSEDEDDPDKTEEPPDEEAEADEEKPEEEEADPDDVDELLVALTIDGKEVEVPLKELKQSYSGNKFIEANIQRAVEVRKAVEYNAAALYDANQQMVSKLQNIDAVLDTMTQPNIDWADLRARNPTEYMLKREELREIQDKQKLVQQEVERVEAEQAALQAQARQRLVLDQATLLADRVPELADPKKAPAVMDRLMQAAAYFGFSKEEVGQVIDHRQMLVLHAVAGWLQEREQRAQVRRKANGDASASTQQRKVLIRPGSSQANTAEARSKRLTADAYNRARKSGSVEDVAMTLLMPKRK